MKKTIAVRAAAALVLLHGVPALAGAAPETETTTGESAATSQDPGGIKERVPGAAQETPALPARDEPAEEPLDFHPEVFGYLKAGYFLVVPPSDTGPIGSRSGFRLINARVGVSLKPTDTLEAVLSVDGALPDRDDADALRGGRVVGLRDAFLQWTPNRFVSLRAGQFKAPFNAEALLPDDALPFITRSIVSEGLLPPEGFRVQGMSLERQVGVQLASERLGDAIGVQYAVAVVNGNGANPLDNDNNHLAPVARVAVSYTDLVSLGVNGFLNPTTQGELPTRISEVQRAVGADVSVNVAGISAFAMVLARDVSHPDTGLPDEQALGIVASLRYLYEPLGVEAGARYAQYEPSTAIAQDQQREVTAMVGYRVRRFPARILLQYTLRMEEAAVAIGNDSVDALAQFTF